MRVSEQDVEAFEELAARLGMFDLLHGEIRDQGVALLPVLDIVEREHAIVLGVDGKDPGYAWVYKNVGGEWDIERRHRAWLRCFPGARAMRDRWVDQWFPWLGQQK